MPHGGSLDNRKLRDYIASLSDQDRETYRHFIEEALQRDKQVAENCETARKHAESCERSFSLLRETAAELNVALDRLNEQLARLPDVSVKGSGGTVPGPCWN